MVDCIVEDTLYNRISAIARQKPAHCALDSNGHNISYARLVELADQCAAALVNKGVRPGDRVAFMSPPRPEVIAVLLACSRLGAIFAGLGLRLQDDELKHVLTDSAPVVIFCPRDMGQRSCGDEIQPLLPGNRSQTIVRLSFDKAREIATEFEAFLAEGHDVEAVNNGQPESPLALIYTSGSTGKPKGAAITNLGILTSVTNALSRINIDNVRSLSLLPIDHVAFLANEVVMVLLSGGTSVQLERFDVEEVLTTIEGKRITLWAPIPTMLQRLAASGRMDDFDLSSLDYVWWPGPLSKDAFAAIRRKARRLGVSYGMTEAAGGITFSCNETAPDNLLHIVGKPLPSLEVRLDEPTEMDGHIVGEILIRGPQVIKGYWHRPDATAASFTPDGWFRTGDLGAFDGGDLSIVGRKKELIRSGGYNISPYEVEAAIESHEAIAFAIVAGIRDDEFGEVVVAAASFVSGRSLSVDDIQTHVRRHLPGYKAPKYISTRDNIPFLANGKVDRKLLQEQLGKEWANHQSRKSRML
jgi:acyl-CoA synthetase (AMP-forming)/AMP-acid ligase II